MPESDVPRLRAQRFPSLWKWLRRVTLALAVGYPLSVLSIWVLLRVVGDYWWLTLSALYLPRFGFLLPLVLVVPLLLAFRLWRLFAVQLGAALFVLFVLMGLELGSFARSDDRRELRVLSMNVNRAQAGAEAIAQGVFELEPDIVFVQEAYHSAERLAQALKPRYPHVAVTRYTLVASRFGMTQTAPQDKLPHNGRLRSARFQRHVADTPLGPMVLYDAHPLSPRGSLELSRFRGAFGKLKRGELLSEDSRESLEDNAGLRRLQLEELGRLARAEAHPVIIAGDFNLPDQSPLFADNLGSFQDGFEEAGSGFGHTYPAKFPWLRLDRVLASRELEFVSFGVDCEGLSDHLCVVAQVRRRQ